MPELVTIGETMVLLAPLSSGPLRQANLFERRFGGAESNVAIGFSRLGASAGWISKLGRDEFGAYLLAQIRGEGVDTSRVRFDDSAPTGVYFKELRYPGQTRVYYYRAGSAASRLSPDEVDWEYVRAARMVHLTGITMALSENCRVVVQRAVAEAKAGGALVSFDPNIRLKLWDAATARRHILPLLAQVDMVFPGLDEARLLLGEGEPEALLDRLLSLGPRVVALKLGAQGALAGNGTTRCVATPPAVTVIDPVGAGDAFDAAFLFGTLRGLSLGEQLRLAVAAGTITTTIPGDYEGLASYQELVTFAQGVQVREGI